MFLPFQYPKRETSSQGVIGVAILAKASVLKLFVQEAVMLLQVDHHSGVPIYRQIMDQIKFHIASGLLKQGDPLPSIRTLSAQIGVNPMTISKSYAYLEKEGLVLRRPGRPLVVKANPDSFHQENRFDQLRRNLRDSVTVVKQLGLGKKEALATFERLLEEEKVK